jgi:cysteine desulfurase/selenocysteine lyase
MTGATLHPSATFSRDEIEAIRNDFPVLKTLARGKPLVYLDNAATTLKPRQVVEVESHHYLYAASNIHRGVHFLSEQATQQFEGVREKVRAFLNARECAEIIFTPGTTGSVNLVAHSYGNLLSAGDEILITTMEHHSNIVPWQMLCERRGLTLKVVPINDHGEISLDDVDRLITPKTKLVSMVYVSNALGTINPVRDVIKLAHARGVPVMLDAAQAVAHMPIDVQALGADFVAFSGHKLFAPTGIGVLYGRRELLERMPPFLGGGDMIRTVSFEKTTYAGLPAKFEAGTPHIGGVLGLGAAIDYVSRIGLERIGAYEQELLAYGTKQLSEIPGLKFVGTAQHKASILGFVLDEIHPHDIGSLVDQDGIAIRVGHHCAQPVMKRFGVPATARASLSFYNVPEEIDTLVTSLLKVKELFA